MYNRTQNTSPLTRQQMVSAAPSLFASAPHESRSEKYIFEPTVNIIDKLTQQGLHPIYVAQRKTKKPGYAAFTKHLVIMRQDTKIGEYCPEILITNSHDGSTSRIAELGFFRAVCANGLILNDGNMGKYSSSHIHHDDDFIEGVFTVLATAKDTSTKIDAMKARLLHSSEAIRFVDTALRIRWDIPPMTAMQAARTYFRTEDSQPTLWNMFNRMQEQLQRGVKLRQVYSKTISTRPITSIDETIRINRALGQLATSYLS